MAIETGRGRLNLPETERGTPRAATGLRYRQTLTVALLFGGYAACYFCRADLSVATPMLVDELGRRGMSHADAIVRIGGITSLGVLAYALGKLFLTGLGDYWGGRPNFLIGLGGAALFTLMFALGGALPVFTLAWAGNRLTQSVAWAGLVKVSTKWFNYSSYGTILGILSVSFLAGDALARQTMGTLIAAGFGWRALFFYAGAVAALLFIANALWLRESRVEAGFADAEPNPLNLFARTEERLPSIAALLKPLIRSPAFLLVCVLSFGCTVVRETFNAWTPVYLRDWLGYSVSKAASMSAVFPGVGVLSTLLVGWMSDQFGSGARALVLFFGLAASALALIALMSVGGHASQSLLPVAVIGLIAFCLLGPYSYLGGAMAMDFGGKQAAAASSGLIDGVGYLGGVLAGVAVARISVSYGWHGVFVSLAAICTLSAIAAVWLYVLYLRRRRGHGP